MVLQLCQIPLKKLSILITYYHLKVWSTAVDGKSEAIIPSIRRSGPVWSFCLFWKDCDCDQSQRLPEMEKTGLCNGRVWAEGLGGERGQAGTRIVAKSED